jgi:glycosyltransferase involved in cell wall biosynthesis
MRVLFIHQNFPGQFKHVAPALAAQGHEVVALGINKPAYPTPGVKVLLHRPRAPNPESAKAAPDELKELQAKTIRGHSVARALTRLRQEGFIPALICVHSGWGEAFFIKDVFPDVPLLVYAEYFYRSSGGDSDFDPEFSRKTLESLERLRLKNTHLIHGLLAADRGLSPTRFQRDCHPEVLRDKIEVIHDGIDTKRFVPDARAIVSLRKAGLTLRPKDEVVTFVARELEPYRGYHSFMRALPELLALRPNAQIVIVGGHGVSYGAPPPVGTTWKDLFLNEVAGRIDRKRVHFVGKLPHALLTQLMQVSTAHVYLTYPFVVSWSLMEAMSIGCLVVGSRTAPVQEVVEHGRTGLLVDFFDLSEIASTVADALERRTELQDLRKAARQHIVQHYDLKTRCLPAQLELLQRLAAPDKR